MMKSSILTDMIGWADGSITVEPREFPTHREELINKFVDWALNEGANPDIIVLILKYI